MQIQKVDGSRVFVIMTRSQVMPMTEHLLYVRQYIIHFKIHITPLSTTHNINSLLKRSIKEVQ